MRGALPVLVSAALFFLRPASAADEPAAWLLQASDAARTASYEGVVVYRDDSDQLGTLHVLHRFRNAREQERLSALDGPPRDVFRENGRVVGMVGEPPARQLHAALPGALLPRLDETAVRQLAQHYDITELGAGRVAGRPTRGIEIVPRDGYRYGFQIWADAATGVPLKVSLLGARGRLVQQLIFTQIAFPPRIADAEFVLPAAAAAAAEPDSLAPDVAPGAGWKLGPVPAGFEVVLRTVKPVRDGDPVEHVQLSDGLSAVSIFSARAQDEARAFNGYASLGAMNAYARRVGGYQVTVVGEVPRSTVRMIGDGVQPQDAAAP
ncbi:MAG TPA: MucB/RseB C-terminal domain-containing protein [Candidatus Binatia bacterium]|nr:MucB/RseB C-terminal domain-containing protein [Candidatus Binatia bacterium]